MGAFILIIALLILFVYAVIPTALIRLHIGVIARLPTGRNGRGRVALTFDDGPDPRYTPQILDILKRYQVKAAFFVTGNKAKAHPDLIKQIAAAGHELGNHGFRHRAAWVLGPQATISEIKETDRLLEELTGQEPVYYRPTWGICNLASIWYCWSHKRKIMLWTYMSWDWTKRATPAGIADRVLRKMKDGTILIFHDSDSVGASPGAPRRVIAALPPILEEITRRGWQTASLNESAFNKNGSSPIKKVLLFLWGRLDWLIRLFSGIKETKYGKSFIWRLAMRRYRGRDWPMTDGTSLKKGDAYLELHINNEYLLRLLETSTSTERTALIALREIHRSLPQLARLIQEDAHYATVKVLLGITLLHRGSTRLGFTSYPLKKGLFQTLTNRYEHMILALFHPKGLQQLQEYREKLLPRYTVITRQELLQRYPPAT